MTTGVRTTDLPTAANVDLLIGAADGTTVGITAAVLINLVRSGIGPSYENRPTLYADLDWPEGSVGAVYGDGDEERIGTYLKSGASGEGAWAKIGELPQSELTASQLAALTANQEAANLAEADARMAGDAASIEAAHDRVKGFTGAMALGPEIDGKVPLAMGRENSVIAYYDPTTGVCRWKGLVSEADLASQLAGRLEGFNFYDGSNPLVPTKIGLGNAVFEAVDTVTGRIVLSPSFEPVTETTIAAPTLDALSSPLASADWTGLQVTGQSNGLKTDSEPALSTNARFTCWTFGGGPVARDPGAGVQPLLETSGETVCTILAATFLSGVAQGQGGDPNARELFVWSSAQGGTPLYAMGPSSTFWDGTYLNSVSEALDRATVAGKSFAVAANILIHGEADAAAETSFEDYLTELTDVVTTADSATRAITGQAEPVRHILTQSARATPTHPDIALAQLEAYRSLDLVAALIPSYQLTFNPDNPHLTNEGKALLACYQGRALEEMQAGYVPQCLEPLSASYRGSELRVRWRVPTLPLIFDTSTVQAMTDQGFAVTDDGNPVVINSILNEGNETVIQLPGAPTGELKVSYALAYATASSGSEQQGAGNLFDSSPDTRTENGTTYRLRNPALAFEFIAYNLGDS